MFMPQCGKEPVRQDDVG